MPKLNLKPAFTLIELLVVMTIIATLAGAILYSTNNVREKGRDGQRKENLKSINSALISYHVDNKTYPPQTSAQRDFASDSADTSGWIPDIAAYLEKIPKDPQQASAGQVAGSVSGCSTDSTTVTCTYKIEDGADDILGWHDFNNTPANTGIAKSDNELYLGMGNDSKFYKPGLRFSNLGIPEGTNITSATIKLTAKDPPPPSYAYELDSGPLYMLVTSDINNVANGTFETYQEFIDALVKTTPPVGAENYPPQFSHVYQTGNIPAWTNGEIEEIDVADVVQDEVDDDWDEGDAINFIMYPQDTFLPGNTANSMIYSGGAIRYHAGRAFYSSEGDPDKAPELEVKFPDDGSIIFPPTTCNDPDATNNGEEGACVYPPLIPNTGICDNKQGIFCLRVNDKKTAFVLWSQLENENDRDHFSRSEAVCNQNDPDFDPTNTSSPYKGLGRPEGGYLNYCIKSPL